MPDAPPQQGSTEMDPGAVSAIAYELGELGDATVAAGTFAAASPLTQADFGDLPTAQRAAGRFLEVVASLAQSVGYVGTLVQGTEAALKSAAGLQVDNEAQSTALLNRSAGGI
ncbi:hypothetical protein [Actinokineospora sp.]|uniref:hypothetical protein n=1 Tax=Actinokineospora sp. TaxID=1872133 RepID=UPI004037E1D6